MRTRLNFYFVSWIKIESAEPLVHWRKHWIISFDHNFARSARIKPSFCTLAKLEELNDFYLDCFESYITKNASFEIPGYLARARARARAPGPRVALGPPALLTIGDYDQRLFARAQLSKNLLVFWAILSRGSFFYFCVNFILFCLNCVQMFYNLFNFSRVFNLTLCVSAGKITQSWKKTRARAPLFKLKILVRSPGVV